MGFFYEKLIRPCLFRVDSERAHEIGVDAMAFLGGVPALCRVLERWNRVESLAKPIQCFGLSFPNAVGLAAGFDKNGRAWPAAAALGFGHVEIGTVTHLAQAGNPRPRVFRFPHEEAIINRMGFPNAGAVALAKRLSKASPAGKRRIPLGINLGKSKVASLEDAVDDYLASFTLLADYADYVVINVSSPNTPDLRKLQEEDKLKHLLQALVEANAARTSQGKARRPLLLKIAPDLSYHQIDRVLVTITDLKLDGIIATNTTLRRPGDFASVAEAGGLSGAPLKDQSTQIINYIFRATAGKLPIVGVGGIMDESSAAAKMDAGASLIQIYTGLIYRGPFFARDLSRAVNARQIPWR